MVLTRITRLSLVPNKIIKHLRYWKKYFLCNIFYSFYLPGGGPIPPPPILVGALWPRHESRLGPSFVSARDPSGLERSLKNAPPVTARPTVPRPVSVMEDPWVELLLKSAKFYGSLTTFAGLRGIDMYCHPGHLRLGLLVNWSFSAAWSGI